METRKKGNMEEEKQGKCGVESVDNKESTSKEEKAGQVKLKEGKNAIPT